MRFVELSNIALGGMDRAQQSLDLTASRIARAPTIATDNPPVQSGSSDPEPVDTVHLSADVADLLKARQNFAASAKLLQTAGQMGRHSVDILA